MRTAIRLCSALVALTVAGSAMSQTLQGTEGGYQAGDRFAAGFSRG